MKLWSNADVCRRTLLPKEAITCIAKYILNVPRIGNNYFWTEYQVKRLEKFIKFMRGELKEL
jgi:hypothetical protein